MKKLISYKMVMIYMLAIFIGMMVGYLISVKDNEKEGREKNIVYEQGISSQQEALAKKLISQSKLIFETKYLENGEIVREVQNLTPSLYGKSKEEIEKIYTGWKIKNFDEEEIVLYREKEGLPADYYIISSINGYVVLLKSDGNGNKEVVEKTDIPLDSLTPFDKERVMKNIITKDKDEAYQILTNLSS
ncbi:conserved hypothetical protein [Thermoanaerobacter mathranii subsp. mathranii str. A3]|uniref:Bypass of forespore C C-terminal domain-containing protein n=3 Tax=Thermoanaerobacter TaxID=1754 RepID=D3T8J1_THEIA|nr:MULTISPECIES: hypothetical protein [Thermoanaerobacter]MDK2814233.1 hypothetical protein [Thermoanaerobacter sp.]ADD02273.1 conserved hypothetical protein [Thermoanaerobacter italicus Ab9]ADH60780.1 conserved hypothetical protein [Thermoanaerobacter mathranii subsp. mathranii str. A3]MBT1279952.1 hypothetical protein [Thermoanaerobacter sp. CM-CNRG TB177]MDP9749599.1 hypothetical protein [Thermoanaerobacter pentosaceus]